MANRNEVYSAINGERDYQDQRWADTDVDKRLSVGEGVLLIEEYAARARETWAGEPNPELGTLQVIRKIAALAVRVMEAHGAPRREGF